MLSLRNNLSSFGDNSLMPLGYKKTAAQHLQQHQLHKSSSATSEPRFDIVSRTYADTDTLSLYFTKAKPGVIADTDHIATGVVADYDDHGKLVSLDIRAASKRTPCHFFNTGAVVDGKQPLAVNWHYNAEYERLVVLLSLWDVTVVTNIVETDNPNISLGMDLTGKLCAVFVSNPVSNTFIAAKQD